MKPIPGADEPGETVDQRVAEQIERARRRRLADKTLRTLMAQRRAYGLAARYALKEQQMTPTTNPRHTDTDIYRVRMANPLAEVVREHGVTLTYADNGGLAGRCPFCQADRFTVTPARGYWYCYGCSEGGEVISFVRKTLDLGFPQAIDHLAQRAGIDL